MKILKPWGWSTAAFVKVACVAIVGFLALSALSSLRTVSISHDNRTVLREVRGLSQRIDQQTSPDAQRRQREAVAAILQVSNCNTRRAIQDAIDGLARQGLIRPGSVIVIAPNCKPGG